MGALIYAAANVATILVTRSAAMRYRSSELGVFAVDAITYIGFAALALRANRYWPIWLAGLQGTAVVMHAAIAFSPSFAPPAYMLVVVLFSYPIVSLLAVGTWRHRSRLILNGIDPPWRRS